MSWANSRALSASGSASEALRDLPSAELAYFAKYAKDTGSRPRMEADDLRDPSVRAGLPVLLRMTRRGGRIAEL
jgi:hypothetical protein